MILYRLAIDKYSDDLSGTGAKLFGGRWNIPGFAAVYATQSISLAVLEIIVHTNKDLIPPDYMLIKIEIPDNLPIKEITLKTLKENWREDLDYTQFIGTEFLKNNNNVALKVPSAIVEEENNIILNPAHIDFKKIKIKSITPFEFDNRFFSTHE
jgi:RES domain-containing protein